MLKNLIFSSTTIFDGKFFIELIIVSSPNWPYTFFPHVHILPFSSNAKLVSLLVEISINLIFSSTITFSGFELSKFVPFPNSPLLFLPHVHILPFSSNAKTLYSDAETFVNFTFSSLNIFFEIFLLIVVPSPN